ncbi:Inositolphosphorylceramide synthase subunit Kei1-domain-containing protein [Amylostereum chailletii]|nr:Inositolphosphorylceramide synthase subunit Kei1-domain-containing protein [Amylostereum chailletii]
MKLMLRPEFRLRPLASFLGFLDLKTGVSIALLFALLNKVAGVYGLLAMLTGAGGSFAQLSLYIYSVASLLALSWGLRAVNDEDPKRTLYFAHLFFADHILSTSWTVFFAVHWWVYTPHDGQRVSNSPAQQALIDGYIGELQHMTDAERAAAAERVWGQEKNAALAIIILGWLSKFFFAALLYSFAHHLRRGTYRSLPLSRSGPAKDPSAAFRDAADDELDGLDDPTDAFYAHSPASSTFPIPHACPAPNGHGHGHGGYPPPNGAAPAAKPGAFTDFVSAPRRTRGSLLGVAEPASGRRSPIGGGAVAVGMGIEGEEVLFDEEDGRSVGSAGSDVIGQGTARREANGGFTRRV